MQVLDMCAAPGSKTAQMMEMQHVDTLMPQGKHTSFQKGNDRNREALQVQPERRGQSNASHSLLSSEQPNGHPAARAAQSFLCTHGASCLMQSSFMGASPWSCWCLFPASRGSVLASIACSSCRTQQADFFSAHAAAPGTAAERAKESLQDMMQPTASPHCRHCGGQRCGWAALQPAGPPGQTHLQPGPAGDQPRRHPVPCGV